MPIDYRIAGSVQAPQLPSPTRTLAEALTLRTAAENQDQVRKDRAEADRQRAQLAAEDQTVQQLFAQYRHPDGAPDYDRITNDLSRVYPDRALGLMKDVDATRRAAASHRLSELEWEGKMRTASAGLWKDVKNQQDFDIMRPYVEKIDPKGAARMGTVYDPAKIAAELNAATSLETLREQEKDAMTRAIEGKNWEAINIMLSTAKTKEQWDRALAAGKGLGLTPEQVAFLGEYDEGSAARAAQLTQTPLQRSQEARAKEKQEADIAVDKKNAETNAQRAKTDAATEQRLNRTGGTTGGGRDMQLEEWDRWHRNKSTDIKTRLGNQSINQKEADAELKVIDDKYNAFIAGRPKPSAAAAGGGEGGDGSGTPPPGGETPPPGSVTVGDQERARAAAGGEEGPPPPQVTPTPDSLTETPTINDPQRRYRQPDLTADTKGDFVGGVDGGPRRSANYGKDISLRGQSTTPREQITATSVGHVVRLKNGQRVKVTAIDKQGRPTAYTVMP